MAAAVHAIREKNKRLAKEQVLAVFDKYDDDGSGGIDKEEASTFAQTQVLRIYPLVARMIVFCLSKLTGLYPIIAACERACRFRNGCDLIPGGESDAKVWWSKCK